MTGKCWDERQKKSAIHAHLCLESTVSAVVEQQLDPFPCPLGRFHPLVKKNLYVVQNTDQQKPLVRSALSERKAVLPRVKAITINVEHLSTVWARFSFFFFAAASTRLFLIGAPKWRRDVESSWEWQYTHGR